MFDYRKIALFGCVVTVLSGCSSANATGFWTAVSLDGLEADQPTSAAELADRADVVVRGTVTSVEPGPIDNPAYDDEQFPIVAVNIAIDDVIDGAFDGTTIRVIMPRQPTVSVESLAKRMPTNELVIFAVKTGVDDYYATFSDLSIVTTVGTQVRTALDPDSTHIVTGDAQSWAEAVDVIEEAATAN